MWDKIIRLQREGRLGFAVAGTLGNWISAIGERTGTRGLIFNQLRFTGWHHRSLETAPIAVAGLLSLYPSMEDAIDLGCGTGVYVNELRERGVRAEGYEHSPHARRVAKRVFGLDIRSFDLSRFDCAGKKYDICLCLEVGHYLTAELGDRLVAHCARAADVVAFSSAHRGQGGYGAVNAQSREYWIDRFALHRLRFGASETAWLERHLRTHLTRNFWLAENICLFIHEGNVRKNGSARAGTSAESVTLTTSVPPRRP